MTRLSWSTTGFSLRQGTPDGIFITKRIQQITNSIKNSHRTFRWFERSVRPHSKNLVIQVNPSKTCIDQRYSFSKSRSCILQYNKSSIRDTRRYFWAIYRSETRRPFSTTVQSFYGLRNASIWKRMRRRNVQFIKLKYRIRPNACTREERMSGYHGNHLVDWSGYADDLELFLENVNNLQKALTSEIWSPHQHQKTENHDIQF